MSQVVLITGASTGFGRACATYLQGRGYQVFGTSRRAPTEPTQDPDGGFTMIRMDVDEDASVQQAVELVRQQAGRIDAVVNNAGTHIAGALEDHTLEEVKAQFETNVFGVVRVCRAVLPIMRAQQSGTIINISSIAGVVGIPFETFYSATKFALEGMSEALRIEVAPFGVRVVLIEPGDAPTGHVWRRAAASLENPLYRERCENCLRVMSNDEEHGFPPVKLAQAIERILTSRKPRLRYVVAPAYEALVVVLKRLLPGSVVEWGVRKYYKV